MPFTPIARRMSARRLITRSLATTALLTAMTGAAAAQEPSLTVLTGGVGNAVSANGGVVVGHQSNWAVRWTESGGIELLGNLSGSDSNSAAYAISADGSIIAGEARNAGGAARAFRWTQGSGMQDLGLLNGGDWASARSISADGTVIVGIATDGADGNEYRAFRWTQGGGMQSLGTLAGGNLSHAYGISGDGNVIVGDSRSATSGPWAEAFMWTQGGGMVELGKINNGDSSVARAASYDGSVIAGTAMDGAVLQERAFRWTQGTGMESLGVLNGGTASRGNGVSSSGLVIVGAAADGADGNTDRAFRWTDATGMQIVEDWLRDAGATIAGNVTREAIGVNEDGSVITGRTDDFKIFIARAGTPGGPSAGLITLNTLSQSLGSAGAANTASVSGLGTLLNGAGSRPLDRRAKPGGSLVWAAGDIGRDGHGDRDGSFALGEIGGGHDFGPMQINAAFGYSGQNHDTAFNGDTELRTAYVKLEALSRLHETQGGGIWAILSGAGAWGDADIKRGYLVGGGAQDASKGGTDITGYGIRGRLQWENAISYVSPYTELSWSRACLKGYTETGGAFPAAFDKLCDEATEARLGADATVPLTERIAVIGTLEGVHRFEDKGSNVTGQVIGLGAFNLGAADYDQDWLRAGAGIEIGFGASTLSLMANATTKGEGPSAWGAATWKIAF